MINVKQLFMISTFFLATAAHAQQGKEQPLWPAGVPDSKDVSVSDPTITLYLPEKNSGTTPAVVICPGGGYARLAIDHEGHEFARWLNQQGIAGIVLKYRLPAGRSFVPLQDVQQAIRMVRSHAKEWNINPTKTGVAGFSAGGHLAGSASVLYNEKTVKRNPLKKYSARPDFSILVYPVISMEPTLTHAGSRKNLIGDSADLKLETLFTLYKLINKKTPPTILFHSVDDKAVVIENSRRYYNALLQNKVPAKLLELPSGGHGWGMRKNDTTYEKWLTTLKAWLEEML